MKRNLLAVFLTLILLVSTYGTVPSILAYLDRGSPKAAQGELDLSAWDFTENGVVPLNGEWEFYPNLLLETQDFVREEAPPPKYMQVPGSWMNKVDGLGHGTYRLLLNVVHVEEVYGLKTLSIQMSARIFVNGYEIGESGNPEKAAYQSKNKPFSTYFMLNPGWNEIIVQTANYDFPASSDINHPIYFGYQDKISELQSKAIAHDWITVSSFLIMGLYFIGMYAQRSKDAFLLTFGFLCVCIATFSATRGERILYDLFGDIPSWIFLRIQMISTLGASIGIFLYVYSAFRTLCSKLFIKILLTIGAILAVITIISINLVFQRLLLSFYSIYVSFAFVYMMYILVSAALHRFEGSYYLTIAAVALNIQAFLHNINVYFPVPIFTFPSVQPFVFLLMLALLMSLRFSNAYKQNKQLSSRLLQADRLKDEFLTKTAHEFKTPLHGIIQMAQSMTDDTAQPLTLKQQEKVDLISTTTKRLSQLVYDIMDLSKLKQGEMTIQPVSLHVRSTVDVILEIFSFITLEKNVRLVNSVPDELSLAFADENRFRQIVSNLLDNAIKNTSSGYIEVLAKENERMVEISVKDTGAGIDEADLGVIFEPFKSLHSDSNQSFGIGLSIVKQLVELQNGSIWVTSVKGSGTTFTFSLPVASISSTKIKKQKRQVWPEESLLGELHMPVKPEYTFSTPYISPFKGEYTILAIDDQFSSLKVLIDALERLDYKVIAVQNGTEALKQMESQQVVDLVIADLMLPGLSGFDICREIRRNHSPLELPILMVTASIHPKDKIATFEVGANDFLPKPYEASELRARVKSLLVMKEAAGKAVDLEVAFLQSQIKPHFLYNVLNTIMALSYTDVERSRKLTTDLADYLRGSFQFANIQKGSPFSNELALIQSYVEIEKARFKDRIKVEYHIVEDVQSVRLPPLLIQPLVENAIRHGIGNWLKGGTVCIRAYAREQYYVLEIEDNGVGMTSEQIAIIMEEDLPNQQAGRLGVGLKNIRKRLKYSYGTDLSIQSTEGSGTKVIIRIPIESA